MPWPTSNDHKGICPVHRKKRHDIFLVKAADRKSINSRRKGHDVVMSQ